MRFSLIYLQINNKVILINVLISSYSIPLQWQFDLLLASGIVSATIVVMSVFVIKRVKDSGSAIPLCRSQSLDICAACENERHSKDRDQSKFVR